MGSPNIGSTASNNPLDSASAGQRFGASEQTKAGGSPSAQVPGSARPKSCKVGGGNFGPPPSRGGRPRFAIRNLTRNVARRAFSSWRID